MGGGLEAGIGLNVGGGEGDSGGLGGGSVGGQHVMVASVAHQLFLPLLDVGRVRLQQLCHCHLNFDLENYCINISSFQQVFQSGKLLRLKFHLCNRYFNM